MPASMINAVVGSSPKVMGNSSAMVASGPSPGITPTAVPSRTPTKQYKRLWRLRAVISPSSRLASMSASENPAENRHLHSEEHHENQCAAEHEGCAGKYG